VPALITALGDTDWRVRENARVSPCNGGYHIKAKKNHSEIARH